MFTSTRCCYEQFIYKVVFLFHLHVVAKNNIFHKLFSAFRVIGLEKYKHKKNVIYKAK